jgi:E3 ubiquitin-protein ligase HUWE1
MVGDAITYHDIQNIDPTYYNSLKWISENDVTILGATFCYEADDFGQIVIKDLIPEGRDILVTEENKTDYVNKVCYAKMATEIQQQIEAF